MSEQKVEQGMRYNQDKLQWSLVDFKSFEPMVRVLEFGAKKYAAHNWKKGLKVTQTMESLYRHLFALQSGEDIDPESGLPHIGHIQCNVMFLAHMLLNRPDMDDRYKEEPKVTIRKLSDVEYEDMRNHLKNQPMSVNIKSE